MKYPQLFRQAKLLAFFRKLDSWASQLGGFALVATALGYYSLYFNHGLNLGGEGGTAAVLAMRLNEGMRPIADTFLGYNVLWFYPVAWLFQITGPDYLALRAFFFFFCAVTAILGFLTVRTLTGSGLLSVLTGLSLILIPGMIFRNYMGFLGAANQLAFASAFLVPPRSPKLRILLISVAGGVVGITFLIRVELGWLILLIWLLLLFLSLLGPKPESWSTISTGFCGGLLAMALVHAPFAWDASRRNYASEFWNQYTAYFSLVRWEIKKIQEGVRKSETPAALAPSPMAPELQFHDHPSAKDKERRSRPKFSEIWEARKQRDRFFAASVYWPLLVSLGLLIGGGVALGLGFLRKDEDWWRSGLAAGTLTGCALAFFPQYYFFRPDTPHITEFMIPFQTALASTFGMCLRLAASRKSGLAWATAGIAFAVLIVTTWIHFGHAWPKESAGTIAARKKGSQQFVALNNVKVWVPLEKARELEGLQSAVLENSSPKDWVVCFPYSPTINFMTNRRSYLWDLYMDNTLASPEFEKEKIAEIEKHDPAVVVVDHRAINKIEASRFPNWAPKIYEYLCTNYQQVGKFGSNEVFAKKTAP